MSKRSLRNTTYLVTYRLLEAIGLLNYHGGPEEKRWRARSRYMDDLAWAEKLAPNLSTRGRALDLGCASGYGLELLSELGWTVYGLDKNEEYVQQTKAITPNVLAGDILNPFPFSGGFNLVLCLSVLEHVPGPQRAIRNVYQTLAEDGVLICTVANKFFPLNQPHRNALVNSLSASEWKALFRSQGFERVVAQGFLSLPPLRRWFGLRPFRFPLVASHIRILAKKRKA